jgi:hypothetical protein
MNRTNNIYIQLLKELTVIQQTLYTKYPLIVYSPARVFNQNYMTSCADAGTLPVFDTERVFNYRR